MFKTATPRVYVDSTVRWTNRNVNVLKKKTKEKQFRFKTFDGILGSKPRRILRIFFLGWNKHNGEVQRLLHISAFEIYQHKYTIRY